MDRAAREGDPRAVRFFRDSRPLDGSQHPASRSPIPGTASPRETARVFHVKPGVSRNTPDVPLRDRIAPPPAHSRNTPL